MSDKAPPDEWPLEDDEPADIELLTGVHMDSVRFGVAPKTRVWFTGNPAQRSSSKTEKENLPEEVEPGTEYRDATVRWQVRGRILHPADTEDDE